MSNSVITSPDIQVKYERLYKFLMKFLWEFSVVQDIANLEISIFKRFPDKEDMLKCLAALDYDISHTYNELAAADDTEFKLAFEDLKEAIESFSNSGYELYAVAELVDDPSDITTSEDMDAPAEKHKFEIGDIQKTTAEERALQEEALNTLSNPFEKGEE